MIRPHLPFRLLVFDWDGTLIDSTAGIVGATLQAIEELGLDGPSGDEIRDAIGLSPRESFARLFPGTSAEEELKIRQRIRFHWLETYCDEGRLFDGVAEAIAELGGADYFLAVATGKSRAGLDRDLETTGLRGHFLATRTADESESKPHPQMLLELMEELGTTPAETLMVGDTTFDLEMAGNAGVACVGVMTGAHGRERLEACEPRTVLGSVAELPRWLAASAEEA